MLDLLESKHRRRLYYIVVSTLLVMVLLLRFFFLPAVGDTEKLSWAPMAARSLETIFGAIVASVVVTFLIAWLHPPLRQRAVMDIVLPFINRPRYGSNTVETWRAFDEGR